MKIALSAISLLLLSSCAASSRATTEAMREASREPVQWAIALHGGGGTISRNAPPERQQEVLDALAEALDAGRDILADGGTSLDAVEATVRVLEDSPLFNAGRGGAVAATGGHELDAAVMRGDTLETGAVTGVRTTRNPISLARHVMENSPHVFMAGDGADNMAEEAGLERVPNEYFRVPARYERWLRSQQEQTISTETGEIEGGTVGAVAVDVHGNLAAATSTGGLTNKLSGRIGDSPIAGIGTYASNESCAISCTGWGEEFIRQTVAFRVAAIMQYGGKSLEEAMSEVFDERLESGTGGAVAVDRDGNIVLQFNTRGMNRGAADSTGRFDVAIWE